MMGQGRSVALLSGPAVLYRSSKKFGNGKFCNMLLRPLNDDIVYCYVKVGGVSMCSSMPMSRSPGCEYVFFYFSAQALCSTPLFVGCQSRSPSLRSLGKESEALG